MSIENQQNVITVQDLSYSYDSKVALDKVSFSVKEMADCVTKFVKSRCVGSKTKEAFS